MIKYILVFMFSISFFYGNAQKVIYSRAVYLRIPPKNRSSENIENQPQQSKIEKETISFLKSLESDNKNEFGTEVNVDIDTIIKNKKKFQKLELSFEPIIHSKNKTTDFPSGEYVLNSSKISYYFTTIVKDMFETKISEYVDNQDFIVINITGTADATSLKKIKYKNEFGSQIKQNYIYKGKEQEIIINGTNNITTNIQLAFLRTYGVRDYFEKSISITKYKHITYKHNVEIYQEIGINFRTVSIQIIILKPIHP